jgi:hypothetical protein
MPTGKWEKGTGVVAGGFGQLAVASIRCLLLLALPGMCVFGPRELGFIKFLLSIMFYASWFLL